MSAAGGQPQIPPWLREQFEKYQKTQQDLQSIAMQRQHLEAEKINAERTLDELKKAADDETVFKIAGNVMVKTTKQGMVAELEERQELAGTRATVTGKQEARLVESLKEQEAKITQAMKSGPGAAAAAQQNSPPPASPPTQ